MREQATETRCERCDVRLKVNRDRNPDARLLRHSLTTGVCANCAATAFLRGMEPLATIIREKGTSVLESPAAQAQFAAVLKAGNADADPGELDWHAIVANWERS